jgi:hypothetical protein
MRILTLQNQAYELDEIPNEVDELNFCVLDNSDPKDPGYHGDPRSQEYLADVYFKLITETWKIQ